MIKMKEINFYRYFEEEEAGEYLEFVNTDIYQITKLTESVDRNTGMFNKDHINFWPGNLINISKEIKDKNLKTKFMEKIKQLFKDERYTEKYSEYAHFLDEEIFSVEEIRKIVEAQIPKVERKEAIDIVLKARVPGKQWKLDKIEDILEIKPNEPIDIKRLNLMLSIWDLKIQTTIIEKNREMLPIEYRKYLEAKENPFYVREKAKKFQNVRIGIDPKIEIGTEIEANNRININFIHQTQIGMEEYNQKTEASVPDGIEVSSPKFHDVPEELAKFCAMCETMEEQGYYYDEEKENAAGQINIGINYLDSTRAILNFLEIYGNSEELLFHILNPEGQLIRQNVYQNSRFKAVSEKIGKRVIDEDISRENLIQMFTAEEETIYDKGKEHIKGLKYKSDSICLRDGNRFEISIPNGGANYKNWIDNIRIIGKIAEVAKRCVDISKKDEPSTDEIRLLELKEELKDQGATLEEKLYIFMDLLFDEDKIKSIYVNRFYVLEEMIEQKKSQKYKDIQGRIDTAFAEVDFEEQYISKIEQRKGIISYDPNSNKYEILKGEER